jgi:hypothetical protein
MTCCSPALVFSVFVMAWFNCCAIAGKRPGARDIHANSGSSG